MNLETSEVLQVPEPKAAVSVLGCKVNQTEASAIADMFRRSGYKIVDFSEKADVYVIHTCTVTGESDRKSRNLIRRAVRKNPDAVVAVTGCYAQVSSRAVEAMEGVDIVMGTGSLDALVDRVEQVRSDRGEIQAVSNGKEFCNLEGQPGYSSDRVRAFLKVQEGCQQFCSYCIIPYARGVMRSRPFKETIEKVEQLTASGFKEIVLTGIRLGAYGKDLDPPVSLASLIKSLGGVPGLQRLRVSSVDPHDFTPELVSVLTSEPVVCPHFHIPLQSGDDTILERMRRRYTAEQYLELIQSLKEKSPLAAFTTDVMVGFPGESEEHFENTKGVIKAAGFMGVHVFKYSVREGTPAAEFPGQVPGEVKARRSREIADLTKRLFAEYASRFLHKEVEVLIEQRDREGLWEGHTPNYLVVKLSSPEDYRNKIIPVRITGIGDNFVIGEGV
ncbi:MAG TPA: tRNA (N(6)-L-threonylcarbamoyladenosine(37)-C(2))-methylthiotransferase MtaB [Clostridia bacterium]|nr:tRNA (N(6)-L-threonylcarbamoyladenosine(37)-C(2))-methylthiotransferase MtaB [Clostridia bacterium]